MAQPFDITLKHVLEAHPADCLELVGLPTKASIDVIDADLATVMAEADKVLRVNERPSWLMHFELQASYDADLPERILRYNVLLKNRHTRPVRSAAVLLRPQADGPEMSGVVRHTLGQEQYLEFHYRVVRLWQKPVESVIAGGIGTLPLAPLAEVRQADLPSIIGRMANRFRTEVRPSEAAQLWTATYVLMGLRYDRAIINKLLRGVREMEESVTYQAIIEKGLAQGIAKGQAEEARRILVRIGSKELGAPDAAAKAALAEIANPEVLEDLIERVGDVENWEQLLAKARSRRRNGAKRR